MKLKLKVLRPFKDKNDLTVRYEVGDELPMSAATPENVDRINDLIARGLCAVASVEAELTAPTVGTADDEPTSPTVAFGAEEYPLAAMKVALEAIGVSVAKNAGVPAVTKAVEALTKEQAESLEGVLKAEEE